MNIHTAHTQHISTHIYNKIKENNINIHLPFKAYLDTNRNHRQGLEGKVAIKYFHVALPQRTINIFSFCRCSLYFFLGEPPAIL